MAGNRNNISIGSGNYIESVSGNNHQIIAGNNIQGNYINMSQDLSQAAADIQQLLTQLSKTQGYNQEDAQQEVANDLATQAQSNPTVKHKLVKWGQSLGDTAAKTTVSEAAKTVVKLALTLAGI
jgi:hypothetical protein